MNSQRTLCAFSLAIQKKKKKQGVCVGGGDLGGDSQ